MKMIKTNLKKLSVKIICAIIIFSPILVFAAQGGTGSGSGEGFGGGGASYGEGAVIKIDNPLKSGTNTLYDFIVLIIKEVIMPLGGVVAVLSIIYAGFMLVTARGDEAKLKIAKRAFTYAAIGALVLLGAWAIAQAIEGTINQLTS